MANLQNLRGPFTPEEAREYGSKGGKASVASRRRKKAVREVIQMMANQPLTNAKLKKGIKAVAAGIDEDDIDMLVGATMGLYQAAIKGNVSAYELIAENLDAANIEDETEEDELSRSLRELGESL